MQLTRGGNEGLGRKVKEEVKKSPRKRTKRETSSECHGQQERLHLSDDNPQGQSKVRAGNQQTWAQGERPALRTPEPRKGQKTRAAGGRHDLARAGLTPATSGPWTWTAPRQTAPGRCWEEPRGGAGHTRTQGLRMCTPGEDTLGRRTGASRPRPEASEGPRAEAVPTPGWGGGNGRPGPAEGSRGTSSADVTTGP